jgi:hypothetical protein
MKAVVFLFSILIFVQSVVEIQNDGCNNKVLADIMKQVVFSLFLAFDTERQFCSIF